MCSVAASPASGPDWLATIVLAGAALLTVAGAAACRLRRPCRSSAALAPSCSPRPWRYDAVAGAAAGIAAAKIVAILFLWPTASQAAAEPVTYIADAVGAYFPAAVDDRLLRKRSSDRGPRPTRHGARPCPLPRRRARRPSPPPPCSAPLSPGRSSSSPSAICASPASRRTRCWRQVALALAAFHAERANRSVAHERPGVAGDMITTGLACRRRRVAGLAFCLTMALAGGVLSHRLALAALGAAWSGYKRPIPALRYAVPALALAVFGRIVWDPISSTSAPAAPSMDRS